MKKLSFVPVLLFACAVAVPATASITTVEFNSLPDAVSITSDNTVSSAYTVSGVTFDYFAGDPAAANPDPANPPPLTASIIPTLGNATDPYQFNPVGGIRGDTVGTLYMSFPTGQAQNFLKFDFWLEFNTLPPTTIPDALDVELDLLSAGTVSAVIPVDAYWQPSSGVATGFFVVPPPYITFDAAALYYHTNSDPTDPNQTIANFNLGNMSYGVVPEPSTWVAIATGGLGVLLFGRRFRQRKQAS